MNKNDPIPEVRKWKKKASADLIGKTFEENETLFVKIHDDFKKRKLKSKKN